VDRFFCALGLDQPYGPLCALVLIATGMTGAALRGVMNAPARPWRRPL